MSRIFNKVLKCRENPWCRTVGMSIRAARAVFTELGFSNHIIQNVLMPYVKNAVEQRNLRMKKLKNDKFTVLIPSQNKDKIIIIHNERRQKHHHTTHMLVYDFVACRMTSGQWLRGKNVFLFDLSPDGKYLIYGLQYKSTTGPLHPGMLTVVSKPPYFTGLYCLQDATIGYMPFSKQAAGGRWGNTDVKGQYVMYPIGAGNIPVFAHAELPSNIMVQIPKKYIEIVEHDSHTKWTETDTNNVIDELQRRNLSVSGTSETSIRRLVNSDVCIARQKINYDGVEQAIERSRSNLPNSCNIFNLTAGENDNNDIITIACSIGPMTISMDNGFFVVNGEKVYDFTNDEFRNVPPPQEYGW